LLNRRLIQRLLGQRRVENRRKKPLRTDDEDYFSTSVFTPLKVKTLDLSSYLHILEITQNFDNTLA